VASKKLDELQVCCFPTRPSPHLQRSSANPLLLFQIRQNVLNAFRAAQQKTEDFVEKIKDEF
jgi:hypothetical protein